MAKAGARQIADGINAAPDYAYDVAEAFFNPATPENGPVFNVLDYGAVADPAVNNQPMIQAAIDAAEAAGGGIVYIPPGTYGIAQHEDGYGSIHLADNVFLKGAGMGETTLWLVDGHEGDVTGLVRSPWNVETTNWGLADLTIDGNQDNTTGKVDGFFTGPQPGKTISDKDVTVLRVEIKEVSRYGFDPHELTERLTIKDSVAHDNGFDGFVLDRIVEAEISGNVSYDNGRHGFNVVTTSEDLVFTDNVSHDNAGAGFVIQRGSEDIESPSKIVISGGESYGNGREGVLVQYSKDVVIDGVEIHHNGMSGVRLLGSSNVTVSNNNIHDNSQSKPSGYSEVQVEAVEDGGYGEAYQAKKNLIEGNTISAEGEIQSRHGIDVQDDDSGDGIRAHAKVLDNDVSGSSHGAISIDTGKNDTTRLTGTSDDDTIIGSGNHDIVKAKGGNDNIRGGEGDDRVNAGRGDDIVSGGKGDDTIVGGGGADHLKGDSGNDVIKGGGGSDYLSGGSGHDTLYDGGGHDTVVGGSGHDLVIAGRGNDSYSGDSGIDTLSFEASKVGVSINASTKTATGQGTDTFKSFEIYKGSSHDDTFRGSDNDEVFQGGAGADTIRSAGGADILSGGEGQDEFIFMRRDIIDGDGEHRGVDTIVDYEIGEVIDVADIAKGDSSAVRVTSEGGAAVLSVRIGDQFEDVARFEGTDAAAVQAGIAFGDDLLV